jgi:hypothetical protein
MKDDRDTLAFRQRQHAEELRREHFKKIEGQRRKILQGAPALFYPEGAEHVPQQGDRFTVQSHSVKVGHVQRVYVKPEDGDEGHWEIRCQLIHDERALYCSARPPTAVDHGRKHFSYAEEHGYGTTDDIDAGGVVLPTADDRREREERTAANRKLKRAQAEKLRLEKRLNEVRKRGMTRAESLVKQELREVEGQLDRAA